MTHITDDDDNLIKLGEDGPADDWFERPDLPEIKNDEWTEEKYTEEWTDNQIEISDDMPETIGTVDPGDEWTETPGGFAKINVDLDDDVVAGLVDVWARNNLHPASFEVYEESGDVRAAVINDIIIEALTQQIERAEAAKNADDT